LRLLSFSEQQLVTIEDAGGNTVTTDNAAVNVIIGQGTGNLSGCTETASGGVTTFNGCSIDTAGSFMLQAVDATESMNVLSDPFTVT
jgi:hypothetical protein